MITHPPPLPLPNLHTSSIGWVTPAIQTVFVMLHVLAWSDTDATNLNLQFLTHGEMRYCRGVEM